MFQKLSKKALTLSPFSFLFPFSTTTIINNQYNFYVDFKGLLYFDDGTPFLYPNCIKDIKFITQFYKNMRFYDDCHNSSPVNNNSIENKHTTTTMSMTSDKHKQNYPIWAQFWGQRNYLRYAISPVIYNHIDQDGYLRFSIQQKYKFQPQSLQIDSEGRIWHPFSNAVSAGLTRSKDTSTSTSLNASDCNNSSKVLQNPSINKNSQSTHAPRQIKGIFSNDLLTQFLDSVQNVQGKITYKYKGISYEIKQLLK